LTLPAFRVRSFRFQWPADLLTSCAFEMETLVLGWYLMVDTGSVLLLTAFGSLQFLGTLAAPWMGVLGDRLGGRTMLCVMRLTYAALAATLTVLALTDSLTPRAVLIVAALAGIVRPNDLVMRTTLIGETMPPASMIGALSLSRANADTARVGGALAGAGLSTLLDVGVTYLVITALYVASLALTFGVTRQTPMPDPPAATHGGPLPAPSGWRDLVEGLQRALRTPELLAMMLLAFLVNLTAYPASGGLLPYIARDVYRVDATGLGSLMASFAFGGLLASMALVATGGTRHPGRSTLAWTAAWYVLLLAFGHAPGLVGGLVLLLAAGFAQNVAMISMTAALLAAAGEGFRGRVMGVRTLAVYSLPLGLIASGVLIERIGYSLTITASATLGLACTLLVGARWRTSLWRRRPRPASSASQAQRV
jgi:MFS family permease